MGRSVISCALSCPVLLAVGFIVHESSVAAEPLELTSPVTSIRKTGISFKRKKKIILWFKLHKIVCKCVLRLGFSGQTCLLSVELI